MSEKLIVIVGITGNQGASVADVFLKTPGWKIRGISRDPTKGSSKEWSDKGVEMVAADLNDAESLKKAFAGANVAFGVTDFWQSVKVPANHAKAAQEGRTINEVAYDIEVQQGKNIVDAAAATVKTLDRFVLSTLSSTKEWSKGTITFNLHFDAKWEAVKYLRATYPELEKKTSFLQVGYFATNWRGGGMMAPRKQPDGTYILRICMNGDVKFPMTDPRADVGSFTKALVDVPAGKNLIGSGSKLSWKEWAALWGEHNGKTITYEEAPRSELEELIPGPVGKELADMIEYIDKFGYDGNDPDVVYPENLGIEVPRTTMAEYIKKTDWTPCL
ncbi:NAD(P)-binding protein [Lophium mytilinum]|uniref:NAD(P)-binding protein n=1 Tax=Lophium mytilinum TaxID=390894 RepID=A0A6A6QYU2_9PEZI|nr:NAD(P)-binding protein [Lophium mytilinum]